MHKLKQSFHNVREHVSSAGDVALAGLAVPDASDSALDGELAAEGAVVLVKGSKHKNTHTEERAVNKLMHKKSDSRLSCSGKKRWGEKK